MAARWGGSARHLADGSCWAAWSQGAAISTPRAIASPSAGGSLCYSILGSQMFVAIGSYRICFMRFLLGLLLWAVATHAFQQRAHMRIHGRDIDGTSLTIVTHVSSSLPCHAHLCTVLRVLEFLIEKCLFAQMMLTHATHHATNLK